MYDNIKNLEKAIRHTVSNFRKDVFNRTVGFDIMASKTICVRCISILGSFIITIGGLGSCVIVINFTPNTNMGEIVKTFIEALSEFSEMYLIDDVFNNTVELTHDPVI